MYFEMLGLEKGATIPLLVRIGCRAVLMSRQTYCLLGIIIIFIVIVLVLVIVLLSETLKPLLVCASLSPH